MDLAVECLNGGRWAGGRWMGWWMDGRMMMDNGWMMDARMMMDNGWMDRSVDDGWMDG